MTLPPFVPLAAGVALAVAVSVPCVAHEAAGSPTPPGAALAGALAAPAPAPVHAPIAFGDRVISVAAKFSGTPYVYGGTTPRGFDCSGFTRFVYAKFHKRLPRTSQQQFNRADRVKHPQIGDLIFYHHGRGGPVYHVGIYAGPGKVWHAPHPGDRVRKGKIYASNWTAGRY